MGIRQLPRLAALLAVASIVLSLPAQPASAAPTSVPCDVTALQDAITAANASGGALRLASFCVYTVSTPALSALAFPIITANVKILGSRETFIRRDPSAADFRLFSVASGGVLSIANVGLQQAVTASQGGAVEVVSGGTVKLSHDEVSGNTASDGGGLSIASGGIGVVRSCTFFDNSTTAGGGGAIVSFGQLTISRSLIFENSAPHNGGGLNVQSGAVVKVVRTVFRNNTSAGSGGAVENLGSVTFRRSSIRFNTAATVGGGIATLPGAPVVLRKTVVKDNSPNNCYPPNTIPRCKN
jgi:hypothetical protein